MAEESYEDSVRRALGIPTQAEKAAEAAQQALREKELEADKPRRMTLIDNFNRTVGHFIIATCNELQNTLQEAGLALAEQPDFPPAEGFLIERMIRASEANQPTVHASRARRLVAHLGFSLRVDEAIRIDVWRGGPGASSPPTLPVAFRPRRLALDLVTHADVRAAIRDYLKGAQETLREVQ